MAKPKYSPAYRTLLKRWNEWVKRGKHGLTEDERAEMDAVAAQLEAYELEQEPSVIEQVVDDYWFLRQAGDLGGVEFL